MTIGSTSTSTGETIDLIHTGVLSAQEIFQEEERTNALWAWILRGGGFLCLWLGLSLLFSPLLALLNILPFLGDLVGIGTGLFSLVLSLFLSILVIAIAWLVYHPLIGGGLLLLALLILFLAKRTLPNPAHSRS
ncbi:MAG: hypothetical protein HQL98_15060 [Magnetococcales bacterium]|nr:hypothetical protein [Magnetococcales bacterium]